MGVRRETLVDSLHAPLSLVVDNDAVTVAGEIICFQSVVPAPIV